MTQPFSKFTETTTAAADEWVGDHSQVPGNAIDEDTWPVVLSRPQN